MTKMMRRKYSMRNRKPHALLRLIAQAFGIPEADIAERGSALLATLMIITGLTLLGLGFVAITQTESAISMNQKNYTQALQVAEAAAMFCVEWFQNPIWARDENLAPRNAQADAMKVIRYQSGNPVGKYKENVATMILFDKPFRSTVNAHRFYGTENNPDIWINQTTSAAAGNVVGPRDFLTHFNIALFNNNPALNRMDNNEGGIITDIRIYAPPVENANLSADPGWNGGGGQPTNGLGTVAQGFLEGGTRFGVATVRVTATKFNPPCENFPCNAPNFRVVATRTVKVTITEWPFPGPQGPVQTNANLNTSGNIQIHWGRTTASGNMTMAKTFASIPWANAYEHAHYEHGYDTNAATNNWPTGQTTQQWPRAATALAQDTNNFLYELMGRSIPDPWWEMRARGLINGSGSTTKAIPFPYAWGTDPTINRSNWFQLQNQTNYDQQQNILFPRIDYNFWKQVAQSADSEPNIYYLQWVAGEDFRDRTGAIRDARAWLDITTAPPAGTGPKSVPGFFFFDTQNQMNPQNNAGGILTPQIDFNGGSMQTKGFVYMNTTSFGTKGLGGVLEWVQMPGEPYRDIGYLMVEEDNTLPNYKGYAKANAAGPACNPPLLANIANCRVFGMGNGSWDFQDLDWSNGAAAQNGIFDFRIQQFSGGANPGPLARAAGNVPATDSWKPVVWFPGCNPGPGGNCSEPHEPYLNLIYPTAALGGVVPGWHNPANTSDTIGGSMRPVRRPKITDNGDSVTGTPIACVAENTVFGVNNIVTDRDRCTSNSYDRDGGLVQLDIWLNGVYYNEGEFWATGNAIYFGSVLAQADASKAGNPDIYFDERLVKGLWPPGNFGFPRVYVSAEQTDQ